MKEFFVKILRSLFARMNRGILLDLCVFVLNIFLMRLLTGNFIELTRAPDEDVWAKIAIALFYTGMLVLAPFGAILKKHQFWKRVDGLDKEKQVAKNVKRFIFSPWISFVWLLIIYAFVVVSWNQILSPDLFLGSSTTIILTVFFGGMLYCYVASVAVSEFYREDYGASSWEFLETPLAAALGDLCIYLNMICFQIFWSYLFSDLYGEGIKDGGEVLSNILLYLLVLCLFYFPPRNFYLAEDIHRPVVWLTILLANLPSFLYFFFRIRIF